MLSDPAAPSNRLKDYRSRRGWTQIALARRTGISRAAVSAIEIRRLVPSVAAALKLAACLECTVEELFGTARPAAEHEWAWAPHAPASRYWQAEVAGRVLFFPCEETAAGEIAHDGIAPWDGNHSRSENDPSQTLVVAGCDPAAGLLASEYARQTGRRMIHLCRSSGRALRLLQQRRIHVAGVHLSAADGRDGNANVVCRELGVPAALLRLAQWEEGVAFVSDQRAASLRNLLQRPLRWIGREPGSGARQCLDQVLRLRKQPTRIAADHRAVATALRGGWADAGVCVRLVSEETGLRFLSVRVENYDLCFLKSVESDSRFQALVRVVRSAAYRRLLGELPGYNVAETGDLELTAPRASKNDLYEPPG
jgi:molybdate-binding protein/DNA-binding XRE family transcriptional regulator